MCNFSAAPQLTESGVATGEVVISNLGLAGETQLSDYVLAPFEALVTRV
jgi:hypothetical protein